ncbi:MAG: DUF6701 domain-containing protein [Methylobacter sp.]
MQKVMMLKHRVWLGLLFFFQQCMCWLAVLSKWGVSKTQINFDAACRPVQAISSRHTAIYFVSLALSVFTAFGLLIASDRAEAATATYTSSTTWTAPTGTTTVTAEVWGGGGGGGGQGATTTDGGGGGGGGAYSKQTTISVSGGNGYTVTVGTGGSGGNGGCGITGGDSWFVDNTTVLAKGGVGGCNSTGTPPAGGAGGAAASGVGATKYSGGNGGKGRDSNTGQGGPGGSSAGTAANGTSGATTWSTVTASAAPTGGGIGGNGGGANVDGFAPATGNGGGGGGSGDDSAGGGTRTGGSGAKGKVIVTYVALSDAYISISGATGTGGAFKIGDTVTATWNNTATGDNNANISTVTVNFSQFGGGTAVAATNSSGTWTATYTIVAGSIDNTNRNISVTATDSAGNSSTTTDSTNATVDNIAPTVTDANISISGATGAGGVYKTGDTVTATWNNTSAGDNNTDTISAVTVDFSQFGGGSAVAATNASGTWTATYIIVAGTINNTANRNVSVTATDNAGNPKTTADTTNATVDNQAPTVSSVAITSATGILNSALNADDIVNVTVTMSEASTVTGTPQLTLNIGGTLVQADYASGSGSTALVFSYTILAGQTDTNGISINANSLSLNSGTIKDAAGNAATLSHTAVTDNSGYKVDTTAPASATATSGVSGNAKMTLNWTTSSATDFNTASGSVVYRWASGSAGAEVPASDSTPVVGSSNGTATVACVVSSAASTALNRIDGTGGSSDCTTTALTTGQTYTYKVFQKDLAGNYDAGATIGSLTLNTTIIADGTNPGNSTVAPGSAIIDLDTFTLQTSAGTDTVTAVTVTLAPTGAFNNIAQVDLTDNSNTARCTAVTNPASNTISFSTCTVPVSASPTTYKVRITPKTHANMPAPPGASYATTGTVTAFTGTNATSGTDPASATITIDNASPAGATATSGVSDNTKVTLSWTTSSATDFNTTSGSVVYRWASATAGSEVPAEDSTPAVGSTNGTATVACVVSSAASTALTRINGTGGSSDCTTTALTNGQAYTYKVFQKDTNGNYDVGVTIGSITPTVNCTSQATGNWNSASTWTQCRSGIPLAGDRVTIASSHNVTLNVNAPSLISITINSGGTLTNTGSNTITLTGDMNNAGTYSGGSGAVSVAGNFTNTGTFTSGSATWTFSGSSAQSITGVTSFTRLTINNANGVTLNSNVTVTTALTLTSGSVLTGSNIIGVTANCPGGVSRTSGFVDGNLRLTFPSGTTTCTYSVGSGTTYAPISLTLTATASGTALTGSTTGNEHPSIATSGVDATKDVNRYWSLWQTGDTATAVTSFNATFTFVSGDVDIGAATGSFIVGKYDGSSWTLPTIGTRTSTTTSISNVSGAITANLGFVAGEAGVVDAPCTSPSGMTCVCDNFARSSLNPSTIFGANWVVGHSSGTFGDPVIVSNSLRLTDATTNVATVATLPGQFPAAGNKITVEFQHYAYGSNAYATASPCSASSPCGADGMALTLSDSTITPVAGAYGGSLGYAQKTGINGFAGGWLGVGIDDWGNFSTAAEGRVGGGSTVVPESVTLRGSGAGSGAGSTNYPYLVSTGTLAPFVDNALSTTRSRGYSYRITVDATAYTWNGSTGVKTTNVKVERDTGSGYTTLPNLNLPDIYTYNTGQASVPENWKLSFTAGTGSATNIHEIRGLKICSNTYTPPSGFSILVDNLSPTTCTTATNGKPVITISARNSYGNVITNYTNTVTLNAKVSSPSGSNSTTAVWNKVSGSANGTLSGNQYTFASADNGVAQFYLTDTSAEDIYISVAENGGTLSTTLGTPLQFRGTAYTVSIPDTLGDGVVAGRNHLMSITRSSGCGVDTTYNGAKNLDGWYSIATGTHPAGAYAPQFCLTNAGGTCLPDTGSCETLSIAAPTLNASSNYLPALTFSSGVANFCLKTTDVGNYSVNLRDDSNVSVPITGSSATLAVRPFAIVASNVSQGAISNPATGDTTGTPMVAGTAFQTMVAGYLWNSAGDIANNGLPSSSAGYTALTAAGTLHSYADTVVLSASTPFAPTTSSDTPVGTGVAGSLTNGSVALTGGTATLSNLSYNEVGSFTLKAQPSINYLNAGIDLTSRVAYFTNPLSSSSTAWVGRFRPDHFTLSPGTTTPGCGTFTYFGQDGFSSTAFLLTAQNANNYTTQNYTGAYAKLDLTLWDNFYFSVSSPPSGATLSASAMAPTGTWNNGIATVTAKHQVSRPTSLTGETNITVKAAPVDSDGVTMAIADVGPATPLRYGRLSLQNAYGSELLDLPMAFMAEYWNGNVWVSNTADQCTTGVSLSVADPIATDGLVPTELFVWDTGSGNGNSGLGYSVAGTTANKFSEPPNQGSFNLNFRAPGTGNTGALDITAAVPDYLKFNWKGAGNENPTARATFGIYKGNSKFIYIRELY